MSNELFHAIRHFHPSARSATSNGVITRWLDPDGAVQPDEATLIASWVSAGRPGAVRTRDPRIDDIPANVNSIPALRAAINDLKAFIRGE